MDAAHLYIHVPFCARRCIYCDFSIAVRSHVPVAEYTRALAAEWQLRHNQSTLRLETLYFGGGTPSKLGGEGLADVIQLVQSRADLHIGTEVTLEANPEDVTPESARAWKVAGINRVSLGAQSFDDRVLSWMHRTHDANTAVRAVHVLQAEGFDNLSIDLIFAAPSLLERSWERDLETAISLRVPHISIYGLTVEQRTPLGRYVARRDVDEAPEERFEEEFLLANRLLTAAGMDHYEVSNYAFPERHSRHNWAYWERRPYAGLGPSAHEFDGCRRCWNVAPYAEWVARVAKGHSSTVGTENLTPADVMAEHVYLGLRTRAGVRLSVDESAYVAPWVASGWATLDGERILRLTPRGWLRLDALASDLTVRRSR